MAYQQMYQAQMHHSLYPIPIAAGPPSDIFGAPLPSNRDQQGGLPSGMPRETGPAYHGAEYDVPVGGASGLIAKKHSHEEQADENNENSKRPRHD
jgi:hypothetical protein